MVRIPFMVTGLVAAALAGTYVLGTTVHSGVQREGKWRAILDPIAGGSVRGGAMVEAKSAESSRFTITIRNATPKASLPWHLHSGTCAAPGGVVGSGYPELHVGPGGTAEAAVTLTVTPPASGSYLIQVHSPTGTPISCGDLKPIGG
jgi:superoxide dismutase, Cu-Zn family